MDRSATDLIADAVRRFLAANEAPAGAVLIAAISGGADSLAMLYALAEARDAFGFALRAATLHHRMRAEADADVEMLHRLCDALEVPLAVGSADVPERAARERISLEVAGREARYAFLYAEARRLDAHAICTGHTLDDQAETVLLRVVSGTGIEGLAGIAPARLSTPPESPVPVWLWRPLLEVCRADTLASCAERGLDPVHDPYNEDPRYPRNRVRHTLIPLLEQRFNPNIREALARLAEIASAENAVMERATERAEIAALPGGGAGFLAEDILSLPTGLRRRVARRILRAAGARGRALGFENVERLLSALNAGEQRRHLDGRLELRRAGKTATLQAIAPPADTDGFDVPLRIPGDTHTPSGTLSAVVRDGAEVSDDPWAACLDMDRLEGPLRARSRRRGDRILSLGMAGPRSVAGLLSSRGVPRETRDRLPLVTCAGCVAWVAGVAVSEEFKITPSTRRSLLLRLHPAPFPGDSSRRT